MATADGTDQSGLAAYREEVDAQRAALYAVLGGLILFYLSPLWGGLTTAFKTQAGFVNTTPIVPPTPEWFTLEAWELAFATMQGGLINSVMFVVPATVLSAVFGSLAATGSRNSPGAAKLGFS